MISIIQPLTRLGLLLKPVFLSFMFAQYAYADTTWLKSWYTTPTNTGGTVLMANSTFRQTITPNASGNEIRLRLTNVLGTEDIVLDDVTISQQSSTAAAVAGSINKITFDGRSLVIIPKGGYVTSDPVRYDLTAFKRYHISFKPITTIINPTIHSDAFETPFVSFFATPFSQSASMFRPLLGLGTQSWVLLESLEVKTDGNKKVVLAVGDSITDGSQPPFNIVNYLTHRAVIDSSYINTRYTDFLAKRLHVAGNQDIVVLNAGISGNMVLESFNTIRGPSLLSRFERDVASVPNLKTVILLEGVNDLLNHSDRPGAADRLIEGYTYVINRLKEKGVNVVLGTLTPVQGQPFWLYALLAYDDIKLVEAERQKINQWIRTQNISDSIVDFDKCLRDPASPLYFLPKYNSGDSLHPGVLGRKAMADCFDLNQL